MGWFNRIDVATLNWEAEHWKWLLVNLKSRFDLNQVRLITPTPRDFPVSAGPPEETAEAVFRCVQKHFGLEEWPCRLEPFVEGADIARQSAPVLAAPESASGAAGIFQVTESKEVVIHYKVEQASDPMALVGTLAHELSHYVVATIKETPPAGWDDCEPITDLTAVFFGFGIFLANSAFSFKQWQDSQHQGWSARRQGYLSEESLSLALALFCASRGVPAEDVRKYLATNPKSYFKSYYKELLKSHREVLWKIDSDGRITGEFVPNPNHRPDAETK